MKRIIRKYIYPLLNLFETLVYRNKYQRYKPDLIIGPRGNDYQRRRRRLDKVLSIRNKKVLIGGVGTGDDLNSYIPYKPLEIVCLDLFDYTSIYNELQRSYPEVKISFCQVSLNNLQGKINDRSIDIYSSDAVLEHCQEVDVILKEASRVLKDKGLFFASVGPLYYCHGGDHLSGYDSLESGYNHLLLNKEDYDRYVESWVPQKPMEKPEDNPKMWIKNGLFSYLRTSEYISLLEKYFKRIFLQFEIEPKAKKWIKRHPTKAKLILDKYNLDGLDLITKAITFIGVKR